MLQAVSLATFLTFKIDFNKNTDGDIFVWLTQRVQPHYGTIRSIQQEQYVLTTVKEMKHFLVKILVNNV